VEPGSQEAAPERGKRFSGRPCHPPQIAAQVRQIAATTLSIAQFKSRYDRLSPPLGASVFFAQNALLQGLLSLKPKRVRDVVLFGSAMIRRITD